MTWRRTWSSGSSRVDGVIRGVMGLQPLAEVTLIRHAYVDPALQNSGLGSALLRHLDTLTRQPVLIGTWAAAHWRSASTSATGSLAPPEAAAALLEKHWTVSRRQMEVSVVLTRGDSPV